MYVHAWASGSCSMDWTGRFDKRDKGTHRFTIADTRGRLDLTVPIAKPSSSRSRWDETRISTHGAWWDVHRVALESAYGRTPYFEFYIDRFLPMLTAGVVERYPLLSSLATAWDQNIRDILGMTDTTTAAADTDSTATVVITPSALADTAGRLTPYRQVRADRLGFIPSLSILDLIFNLGPEAQIYLNNLSYQVLSGLRT